MTNHVHLLVTPSIPYGISQLMQDTGREYVRYFNVEHHRTGTLWEGRFKSSPVDSERYCLTCYRYIESNPVRARMVQSPMDYRWSSFKTNALGKFDPLVTPHELWLELGADDASRCAAYADLFSKPVSDSELKKIRHSNLKGIPLGPGGFKNRIERHLGISLGDRKIGRPPKGG